MNLCQLNTFFLTFWPVCCVCEANRPKSEEKSFQLAEVHLYRIYFLQNPYFKCSNFSQSTESILYDYEIKSHRSDFLQTYFILKKFCLQYT